MQSEQMHTLLTQRLGTSAAEPMAVLSATVQALSETAPRETEDLRAQLPRDVLAVAPTEAHPERSWPEFATRVGELADARDHRQAREFAQVGFSVLSDAATEGQLHQLLRALPDEYGQLAPTATKTPGDADTLLADVAEQAALATTEQARELLHAVLRPLARGASEGQTALLATALPTEFGADLRSSGPAAQVTLADFLQTVAAESTASTTDNAHDHLAAVLTVLRHWAPRELLDTVGQLPNDVSHLVG